MNERSGVGGVAAGYPANFLIYSKSVWAAAPRDPILQQGKEMVPSCSN